MRRLIACLLVLTGCAAPPTRREAKAPPPGVSAAHPWRAMVVYVPQTDDNAAAWVKWFAKNPGLRMTIAMSPRFARIAKDPALRSQFLALHKSGRLEIALQLPNAPILPLLVENPPYGYPDDVIQIIAQAKAGYFKAWNFLPQGLVLPYGAANPRLVAMLERLGFSYIVAALGDPPADGPYQSGSLAIWDGSVEPSPSPLPKGRGPTTSAFSLQGEGGRRPDEGTVVRVWDERQLKERPLDSWILETKAKSGAFFLPTDAGSASTSFNSSARRKPRTWDGSDWSAWMGSPAKDSAWSALRRTREALEKYKNSGQASVQRLDVAFEEIYGAQSSNYFSVFDSTSASPALAEERQHEFEATLAAVYRVINQAPPEGLFGSSAALPISSVRLSSTTTRAEMLADGREHILIGDAAGDALVPLGSDLRALEVWVASDSLHWTVTVASAVPSAIDIYVDLNGQPNVGTPSFLPGRPYAPSPRDAWEYALSITGPSATLYRTEGAGTYGTVQVFPVVNVGAQFHVTVPRDLMRGTPSRWGYQVLVLSNNALSDFIDPLEFSQKDLMQQLADGTRSDIPFIRIKK